MSSILWFSLVMFISPYSNLASVNFILDVINSLVQLGDVHLSIFKSSLCDLILALKGEDLFNKLFFSLKSFLSRLLELLHVFTNKFQFFFDPFQVLLCKLSSFKSSLQFSFLDSELPAKFIKLLLVVNGHLNCCSKILVELFNGDFIVHASTFNNLDSLENIVSILRGEGKLCHCVAKDFCRLFVLFLHQHNSTCQSS